MFVILGLLIVFGSVIGGFAMVNGPWHVLAQPAELLIIFGAGFGAFVASNSAFTLKLAFKSLGHSFKNGPSKAQYMEMLALLYGLFAKMQREGIISVEKDIEQPDSSPLFQRFPLMSKDKAACFFIGDTLRIYLTTGNAGELDKLMGVDMSAMHEVEMLPAHSVTHMAESMPGMGIVAAVLGVVVTMGMIGEPPAILGEHIGAALVGTFLGILLCYGVIGPFGAKMEALAEEQHLFFRAIREAVAAAVRGSSPIVALEYGRRAIPLAFRPTFLEMEQKLKSG
ncbi:MAG: flagellar motor stator protein MotA [Deltaproteobacteria bacterium]|jgi:chemotaxis protein MotA|nr:flagellar motor stator protein MotA [Deltaproteobacteria bacterium]